MPASPPAPTSAAPQPGATAIDAALAERWHALVKPLCDEGTLSALARELAVQGGLRAIDSSTSPPTWRLVVEREALRSPLLRDKLAAVLATALGQALQLELEAGVPEDTPARRDAAQRQRRQAAAEASIHADPVVQELLGQFKTARVVPGSIKPIEPRNTP